MKDRSVKHKEALSRNTEWAKLSPTEQLAQLDKLGLVATKQRKKIAAKMAA
jgi:hypothetical protein